MCFPLGREYKEYILENAPKKRDKTRFVAVDGRTIWYPSKKAEDDPVIHLPHNVAYSYPAQPQPQPEAQYQYPSYMCYPVSSSESPAPNAVAWQGSSKDEVDMQNRAIHYEQQQKVQLVPYQEAPNSEHQYWCKELDGNYTLRTIKEIGDDCKIGHWQLSKDNYWYWVRDPQD
ncbi:MAG: hypothetical protein MMC23_003323 [Stictis urceolatum]|nr:hypothetical protein [Stictis urceolata]